MEFNFLQPTHIKNEDKALLLFIFINFLRDKIKKKHKKFKEYKTKANLNSNCVHMLDCEKKYFHVNKGLKTNFEKIHWNYF